MRQTNLNDSTPDSPEAIEMSLSFLIRRYLSAENTFIAAAVVDQLERLLCHPDCIGYPDQRCAYRKMLQQWRALTL